LAACGGSGEDDSRYFSRFPAPAPIDAALLGLGATIPANIVDLTNALLLNQQRYLQGAGNWEIMLDSGQLLTGLYSNPLRSSGAAFAHAAGYTGEGSIIAVSDEKYMEGLDEFVDSNVEVLNNWQDRDPNKGDATGHGTIVAAVALGESDDFIGTAPDAELLFGSYQTNRKLADLGVRALEVGAVAWNNSWGFPALYLNRADFDRVFSGSMSNVDYLDALDDYAAEGVVVFAVSNNDTQTRSNLMDGLPFIRPSLEAGWIAAANGVPTLSADGDVTAVQLLSANCNESARWCLVADGAWQIPDSSVQLPGTATLVTGSSFAAPQISGALAILEEAFGSGPNGLTPHQLRVRLLASADDDFAGFTADDTVELATEFFKGYSVIYGHGFLDIEAALKPIGGVGMPMPNGAQIAVNAPVLMTGSGLGDAVELSLSDTSLAVKDVLSAGFVMPGTALTAGVRPSSQAASLLFRSLTRDLTAERLADPSALADPFAAFAAPVLSLAAIDGASTATILMPQTGSEMAGVTMTRVLQDGTTKVELGVKLARDNGGLMSLDGTQGATMASVALGLTQDVGNGAFLALSGEIGITDLGGATALTGADSARFDALKLTAGQRNVFSRGDRLSIGVGMPVAIASGETVVDLPVMREGLAAFESVALDLAPENRQVDLEVTYQTALTDGLEMKLSLIHSDNFGNRAGSTDTGGAIAFAFRF
jgi:hypothetical protein